MTKGYFVISLDYELFWGLSGWTDDLLSSYKDNVIHANEALKQIVELLEKYNLKATIAFVGAMNNNSYEGYAAENGNFIPKYEDGFFAATHSVIPYVQKINAVHLLFAQQMINWMKEQKHIELASHTYSHFYCLEKGQTSDDFDHDLRLITENAKKANLKLDSIIFPRNQVQKEYLKACCNAGFTHYRGTLDSYLYRTDKTRARFTIKGALRFLDTYVNVSGHHDYPINVCKEDFLVNVAGSCFLRPYSKTLSFLEPLKINRIKSSMKHAAKNSLIYHIWWHPHNFGANMKENLCNLEQLCKYYVHLRQEYEYQSSFIKDINL